MTKEELEKDAKHYAEENKMNLIDYHDGIGLEEAYLAGAEPREKRIAELEKENAELKAQIEKMRSALIEVMCQTVNTTNEICKKNTEQIEKMKCCENCKHHAFWGDELKCHLDYDTGLECLKTKQNWESAE